jgi:hypothetical protein
MEGNDRQAPIIRRKSLTCQALPSGHAEGVFVTRFRPGETKILTPGFAFLWGDPFGGCPQVSARELAGALIEQYALDTAS